MGATGRRVLAFALAVAAFVGLAVVASGMLVWLGLVVTAGCVMGLLAMAWSGVPAGLQVEPDAAPLAPVSDPSIDLGVEYGEPDAFAHGEDEEAPEPLLSPTRARGPPISRRPLASPPSEEPTIDLDSPLQRALAGLPPKPAPPARYSQRMPVIPQEEQEADEPVQRARRLVPSGQTLGEKREAAKKAKAAPPPDEEVEFTTVPKVRVPARPAKVPLVVARRAGKGAPPADLARGKCSGCGTLLWAPKTRPMSLRCPECDKVTLLK